jgi:hypothetical protein
MQKCSDLIRKLSTCQKLYKVNTNTQNDVNCYEEDDDLNELILYYEELWKIYSTLREKGY